MKKWHWNSVIGLEVTKEFCHYLVSFHCQQKEGRDGLQCLYVLWRGIFGRNVGVSFGGACDFFVRGFKQTCFPSMTPSLPNTG